MSDHGSQLQIVEEFWRQLATVGAVRDRAARRSVARRRALRTAVLVVLALLALAAVALAARAWLFGSPVASSPSPPQPVGAVVPGSARLLSLRVADPAGGPPWGLRLSSTTGGSACVQTGRVVNGKLVVLGIDGSFADDGRAHALPAGSEVCGGADSVGNPRVGGSPAITTASATTGLPDCQTPGAARIDRLTVTSARRILSHSRPFDTPASLARVRASLRLALRHLAHPLTACPTADLRTVVIGALGPAARRVSLSGPSRPTVTQTLRPSDEGGYLFVIPGQSGLAAMRMTVQYANGLTCRIPQPFASPQAFPNQPRGCQATPPGYIYPAARP